MSGANPVGFGENRIDSLPDAISKVLKLFLNSGITEDEEVEEMSNTSVDICPSCGKSTFVRQEGCYNCLDCGHSKCG
ncbi:hypothetical protein [Chengkuizengella axinellae]|uniref:Uncharacterized protein n=1 Tax=Chengkuizengella axinellae TaxID=3064388 RepID=A0ABT9IV28_9BACL|nr:hypothetical protein [Chengkuizengella sp. 2205SS18-9]MDP5273201.1 hypothetical protein [Chengkuizengella sp. 2205SS18-9]